MSLFSGGGLGDYGLELAGMEIVGQVEIDDYCQKILALRWPEVPKWTDIRGVLGAEVHRKCGSIDLISGGFPCQDISTAGKGTGITGERSGLWKEMLRIIREVRPRYVLVENVSGLLSNGVETVCGDLAEIFPHIEGACIPAAAFGLRHFRERVFIFAASGSLDNTDCFDSRSFNRQAEAIRRWNKNNPIRSCFDGGARATEPGVARVAYGIANRLHRLKLLGNGQVVQVVQWIGERIMEFDHVREK